MVDRDMGDNRTGPFHQGQQHQCPDSDSPQMSGVLSVVALPVLVVEDAPLMRRTLRRILVGEGHEVVLAGSCAEATKLDGPFSVAILDLDLGDGCGIDVAHELLGRAVVDRVVFYTGTEDLTHIGRARQLGPVFHKGKLGGLSGLVSKVKELVGAGVDAG